MSNMILPAYKELVVENANLKEQLQKQAELIHYLTRLARMEVPPCEHDQERDKLDRQYPVCTCFTLGLPATKTVSEVFSSRVIDQHEARK